MIERSVIVIGSANIDLTVRAERIVKPGETVLGALPLRSGGGKGANQAVASARAGGAETGFVGSVGDDDDGRMVDRLLTEAGVQPFLTRQPGAPTGFAFVTVSDDAENSIVVVAGANGLFDEISPTARRAIRRARVLVCQLEAPESLILTVNALRHPDSTLMLNAAPAKQLGPHVLTAVDVLIVNEQEAMDLAGVADLDTAIRTMRRTVPTVIVTLGGRGVVVDSPEIGRVTVSGYRVTTVDTTAAGDTFCGVLAARLAQGRRLIESVRDANAAAALAVTARGAQSSIPTAAQVAEFVRSHDQP